MRCTWGSQLLRYLDQLSGVIGIEQDAHGSSANDQPAVMAGTDVGHHASVIGSTDWVLRFACAVVGEPLEAVTSIRHGAVLSFDDLRSALFCWAIVTTASTNPRTSALVIVIRLSAW
jgi:hypothetical protein